MQLSQVIQEIDRLVPAAYAESWDPAGFQIGDPTREIGSAVLALDLTSQVIQNAIQKKADLIICHHPPIFEPVAALREDRPHEALLTELIRSGLSLLALHTCLDAVPGGVADQMAVLMDLTSVETLAPLGTARTGGLEIIDNPWRMRFSTTPGFGRTGLLRQPLSLSMLVKDLRLKLSTPNLLIVAEKDQSVSRVAVCPGSFDGEWVPLLSEKRCDLLVTGEIKHHVQLSLVQAGITVITAGHDVSERIVLQPLAELLHWRFPEIAFAVCPPFDYNRMAF